MDHSKMASTGRQPAKDAEQEFLRMNDTLQQKSGREYDETFYRMVVQHHREGVQMIDRILPRLTRAEVRQMAERMRADQQREIQEFEQKRTRAGATT